jgi:hydrogenase/urease accessory protein HupE
LTLPVRLSFWRVGQTYLGLGISHIFSGVDHLLFVLGLVLMVRFGWPLVKTISAFTLAHSITLTAATLGWVQVPQAPVKAVIALSIVFLAVELVNRQWGQVGFTATHPWLVALIFGLLHGFGFADALATVGLPAQAIPPALLCFNLGVELGQLAVDVVQATNRNNQPSAMGSTPAAQQARKTVWQKIQRAAADHYKPGTFTTFHAFEWSSAPGGANPHRNIIFRDAVVPEAPFSALDSMEPEQLWHTLEQYDKEGSTPLAIPHNGNASANRWTTYDQVRFQKTLPAEVPLTIQERWGAICGRGVL